MALASSFSSQEIPSQIKPEESIHSRMHRAKCHGAPQSPCDQKHHPHVQR